ncbi:MAG: hypothetical protein AB7F41_11875 [Methylocystis sp.]|uniref:hypothetical protein n=1 Tax=Methylocystis sp. TaxID=1911079 RepID=UPI003D123EE9
MLKFEAPARRRVFAQLLAAALISAGCAGAAQAEAGAGAAYVISDQEGYGLLECLTRKADCGKIVADSWCAAHGHRAARAFGRADDVTGVIEVSAPRAAIGPDAAVVACLE